jgi:selenocysteine lyase/cysteine desulfurase
MPPDLPIRLEAGTQNYPGMLGLGAALSHLRKNPPLLGNGRKLMSELDAWLRTLPATEVYPQQCPGWEHRLPLVSFNFEDVPNDIVCSYLQSRGLNSRGGLLCAGPSCTDIGADQGVVRLSPPLDASADEYLQVRQILTDASEVLR